MTLMHWEPMRDIDAVRREMDRLFGDLTAAAPSDFLGRDAFASLRGDRVMPAVELTETDDNIILKLEVPGMAPEDLDIQATADTVTIEGERKFPDSTDGYHRSEFRYGKFSRVIKMPVQVQNAKATADYQNGLLTLTLPKAEAEKNKVVKVEVKTA